MIPSKSKLAGFFYAGFCLLWHRLLPRSVHISFFIASIMRVPGARHRGGHSHVLHCFDEPVEILEKNSTAHAAYSALILIIKKSLLQ